MSQAISWAVKPITSSSAGSSGEPNVSYSTSTLPGLVVATVARGIAAVSRTGLPFRRDDALRRAHRPAAHDRRRAAAALEADRGARLRLDLDLGPLLRRHRRARRRRLPRGRRDARRPGLRDRAGAVRRPRVLDRLPPPGRAGQGDHGHRPDLGRAGGDGHRRRLGARSSTTPTASTSRRSARAWTSSRRASPIIRGLLHDEETTFEGKWFTTNGGAQRAPSDPGRAADLGRRGRREADAAHRRPLRRRLERAVRRPGDVRRQARRAAPPLRGRRPRPGRDAAAPSTSGWRGPRTACASSSAASPTSCGPAC